MLLGVPKASLLGFLCCMWGSHACVHAAPPVPSYDWKAQPVPCPGSLLHHVDLTLSHAHSGPNNTLRGPPPTAASFSGSRSLTGTVPQSVLCFLESSLEHSSDKGLEGCLGPVPSADYCFAKHLAHLCPCRKVQQFPWTHSNSKVAAVLST